MLVCLRFRTRRLRTWTICTQRAGKLYRARSRLYRSQILQVNGKYSCESSRRDLHSQPKMPQHGHTWDRLELFIYSKHEEKGKYRAAFLRFKLLVPAGPGLWLAHGCFLLLNIGPPMTSTIAKYRPNLGHILLSMLTFESLLMFLCHII